MKNVKNLRTNSVCRLIRCYAIAAIVLTTVLATTATAQKAAAMTGRAFVSVDEAGSALLSAASTFDTSALAEILGHDSYDIINSGEPNVDRQNSIDFATAGAAKKTIVYAP